MLSRLSITTAVYLMQLDRLVVYDVDGRRYELSTSVGYTIIIVSWASFILSWVINLLDYTFIHPSMPDIDLGRFPSKLVIYILGRRIDIMTSVVIPSKNEEDSPGEAEDVVIQIEDFPLPP